MPEFREEFHPLNALSMPLISMQPFLWNEVCLILIFLLHVCRGVYKFATLRCMQYCGGLICILLTRSPWLLVSWLWLILGIKILPSHILIFLHGLLLLLSELNCFLGIVLFHALVDCPGPLVIIKIFGVAGTLPELLKFPFQLFLRDLFFGCLIWKQVVMFKPLSGKVVPRNVCRFKKTCEMILFTLNLVIILKFIDLLQILLKEQSIQRCLRDLWSRLYLWLLHFFLFRLLSLLYLFCLIFRIFLRGRVVLTNLLKQFHFIFKKY